MSHFVLNFLNSLYWGCFGTSLAIFGVHFIYRYLAASGHVVAVSAVEISLLSRNSVVKSLNSWKIVIWLTIPFIFGFIWVIVGYFLCGPTESTTRYIK